MSASTLELHLVISKLSLHSLGHLQEGILPKLLSSIVKISIAVQSFEQLTGLVYKNLLHVTELTHSA